MGWSAEGGDSKQRNSLGSTNDKAARGVDVVDGFLVQVLGGDDGLDDVLLQGLGDLLVGDVGGVLCRDQDGVDAAGDGATIHLLVFDSDLCPKSRR